MIWLCKEILFAMTDPKYYFMTLLCHTVIVSNQCEDNHDFEIDYCRFSNQRLVGSSFINFKSHNFIKGNSNDKRIILQ